MTDNCCCHNLRVGREIDVSKWKNLLDSVSCASPFQSPDFFYFYLNLKDSKHQPFALAIEDEDDSLQSLVSGVIMRESGWKRFFSSRAIITGGFLIRDYTRANRSLSKLIVSLNDYLKSERVIYAEIRNLNDYSPYKDHFQKNNWYYIPHLNYQVDCSDLDSMKKRVSASKIRQIRKSITNGCRISWAKKKEQVHEFYAILATLYEKRVRTPIPEERFFLELFECGVRFLVVTHNDRIIGGMVCPVLNNNALYEWFVCGLDEEYRDKGIYPSVLVTWGAMEMANQEGFLKFDFMGAGKPDEPYGVREFKSKFGGALVEHGRFTSIYVPLLYTIGKIAIGFKKRIWIKFNS
jgi:lipid II:glycine glycyltransferase (peptidoglycan interpeptide bridge formation enzyme)